MWMAFVMSKTYENYFNEGYQARIRQVAWDENPYPSNTSAHTAWDAGWFTSLDEEVAELDRRAERMFE